MNKNHHLVSFKFQCSCGEEFEELFKDLDFDVSGEECGLCGFHVSVSVSLLCPVCSESIEIVLYEK